MDLRRRTVEKMSDTESCPEDIVKCGGAAGTYDECCAYNMLATLLTSMLQPGLAEPIISAIAMLKT